MSAWYCLITYVQKDIKRGNEFVTKAALNLACKYYDNNKSKQKDVRQVLPIDFERTAKTTR